MEPGERRISPNGPLPVTVPGEVPSTSGTQTVIGMRKIGPAAAFVLDKPRISAKICFFFKSAN